MKWIKIILAVIVSIPIWLSLFISICKMKYIIIDYNYSTGIAISLFAIVIPIVLLVISFNKSKIGSYIYLCIYLIYAIVIFIPFTSSLIESKGETNLPISSYTQENANYMDFKNEIEIAGYIEADYSTLIKLFPEQIDGLSDLEYTYYHGVYGFENLNLHLSFKSDEKGLSMAEDTIAFLYQNTPHPERYIECSSNDNIYQYKVDCSHISNGADEFNLTGEFALTIESDGKISYEYNAVWQ